MLNFEFYVFDDEVFPMTTLDGVTTSDVQMIKSLLSNTIAELEEVRGDCKYIATELTERDLKNYYWAKYNKVSKKINKLAALQAKIKRNL